MRTKPLKGPEKICRSHCFLGLPLKGFLLCLGILATRKRVYEFLDAYLVGYLVLLQLILDVSFNCFFVSPYCIYEIPSGPEMEVYLRHRPEPLENSVFATVSASLIFPVSLAFSLAGREQGKFFILLRLLYPAVVQKNALSPLSREHRYSVLCRPLNGQAFPEHP